MKFYIFNFLYEFESKCLFLVNISELSTKHFSCKMQWDHFIFVLSQRLFGLQK